MCLDYPYILNLCNVIAKEYGIKKTSLEFRKYMARYRRPFIIMCNIQRNIAKRLAMAIMNDKPGIMQNIYLYGTQPKCVIRFIWSDNIGHISRKHCHHFKYMHHSQSHERQISTVTSSLLKTIVCWGPWNIRAVFDYLATLGASASLAVSFLC